MSASFACNMTGYVNMVQKILSTALSLVTMFQSTIYWVISSMPDLAMAWEYSYEYVTGAGDWIGYLIAAIVFFGEDFGYGKALCRISEYGYVAIYYMNLIMSFGSGV